MSNIASFFYKHLPKDLIRYIGSRTYLRTIRDFLLRKNGVSKTIVVKAFWEPESLHFLFKTDIKTSIRAQTRGIESSLLKLSLKLLNYKSTPNDKIIFDVGSSFGYLSMVWAKTAAKEGRVFAFEASRNVFECLSYNVTSNEMQNRITALNQPVFNKSGMVLINDAPSSSHISMDENGSLRTNTTEVNSVSIDDFCSTNEIDKIDLIKIDVDGVEFEILSGATKSLQSIRPIIVVEPNEDLRIPDLMRSFDYELYDMHMNFYLPDGKLPNNLICIPKK